VNQIFRLGSPPDIEANIAPNETYTEGKLMIDSSITHIRMGKLEEPVEMLISNGGVTDIYSKNVR
jgi:leucyl aminopeptidase (aminopeptidase T)